MKTTDINSSCGKMCLSAWKVSRGKLFAIGVSVIVSMILATAKSTQVPPLVPFFYRCLGAASVLLCISIYSCGYGIVTQITGHWKLLLVRSVCDGSSAGFIWMSLSFFPLTEIGFVLQTQAAFTMLVAFIILREKPSLFQIICAVGATIGAIIFMQPPILGFPERVDAVAKSADVADSSGIRFYFGLATVVCGLLTFAFGATMMRMISTSGEIHWAVAGMLQGISGAFFSLLALYLTGSVAFIFAICTVRIRCSIGAIVLLAVALQGGFFFSMKYEKASLLPILLTTQVVFMPIADFLLYHTLPLLNIFHYAGSVVILVSVLSLFVAKHLSVVRFEKRRQEQKTDLELEEFDPNHQQTSTST